MFWNRKNPTSRKRILDTPSSSPVYSYYNSPTPSRSNPEKSIDLSKSRHRLRLIPTIVAATVILASLLLNLTLSSSPVVSTVDGNTPPYRNHDEYRAEAQRLLNDSLGNKTKLTIQTGEIEQQLLARFPELKAAALRLPILGRRPNLIIEVRSPKLILSTPGKSYILDNSGRAVSELQNLSPDARQGLLVVKDESGLDLQTGSQAITTETVSFISAVSAQLKAQSLTLQEFTLPQVANELDIKLEGLPYYINTDASGDARLQIGSFLAVKERLSREGVTPSEYVDVRVEEKVFYK
jgi:hypothetical protein